MPPDPHAAVLAEVRGLLTPLKRYTVERVLGSGAMGSVVLVRHDVLGRRALKLINPTYLRSETLRRRFFNEARVMARLRGPHLVEVYEVDDVNGYPFIIMEYLEGGTLFDHLVEFGCMPPRQATQVAIAILTALSSAHTHTDEEGKPSPIIHRDVKAENLLLTKGGTPKLGDFGIAHIESGTRQLTADVTTLGTLAYMAPEQRDARNVDGRADLYAVAVTLYIMLMNPERMWNDAFHVTLARNPDMMDGVPPVLAEVIRKATSEQRDDRYSTAEVMAQVLKDALGALPEGEITHALGTAPEVERARREAQRVRLESPKPGDPHVTILPPRGGVHASSGGLASVEEEGRVVSAPKVATSSQAEVANPWGGRAEPAGGTLHGAGTQSGTQFERELDSTRRAAKRKFFLSLGVIAAVLVIAVMSVWYLTNSSTPVAIVAPTVQEEPVSVPSVTPKVETVVPVSAPVQVAPPAPTKIEKKTQKTAAVVKAPAEVALQTEPAMVRLILKEDTVATIKLVGAGGTFSVSPADTTVKLPEGTYQVTVQMDGRNGAPQTGTLNVTPGITTITCTARFQKCTGIK